MRTTPQEGDWGLPAMDAHTRHTHMGRGVPHSQLMGLQWPTATAKPARMAK